MTALKTEPKTATDEAPPPGYFGAKILDLADRLARFSEQSDALTCTFFSEAHKAAAAQLRDWMAAVGLDAKVDAVGNIIGRYVSAAADAKALIVGSHYDTVVNAGRYDGRLGILTGLVVAEYLQKSGRRLPFHLDVIGFSEEEGVRFGAPYLGSSAIAGRFDPAILRRSDADGVTLAVVLQKDGVDAAAIRSFARAPGTLRGYVEVHIEQGPVLLQRHLPLGVVTGIAASGRFRVTIHGTAGHAGTVPMPLRHDAAAAAAEIVLAIERRCSTAPTLVGTVGQLMVPQGAINVIPGVCEFSIDIRAGDDATRDVAIADVFEAIKQIIARRGVTADITEIGRHAAVPCAPQMQSGLAAAVARAGIEVLHLPSGAGHDAAMFAGVTDIGMLFVRCGNGGISHSPLETITAEDADLGARVLLDFLLNLDQTTS
ncbi:MAG TPA: allantoate amidohydrolase [Xanthobacteraceae bacterium]|jgi:hydantoinase/carbamoylase family amidase|nr:allantoate amidohydrolase [Xanthobacteraceae bacterium]